MTTIAYRDGVIAADTAATRGNVMVPGMVKVVRVANGDLAAASGSAGFNGAFLRWAASGCEGDPPKPQEDDSGVDAGVIFRRDGAVIVHEPAGWFEVRPPYYAVGSGKEIALGVMFAGGSAVQAVQAAVEHDIYSGGPITVLRHEDL